MTSYNYARNSDFVFSETLTIDQFNKLYGLDKNIEILNQDKELITYQQRNIVLKSGDVIFCNSSRIELLFYYLRKSDKLNNLKLITHQTDKEINEKLFRKKPRSISKWYGINVNYNHKDLVPIPIGLANNYSPKNLLIKDFLKFKPSQYKKQILYVNNRRNTNHNERDNTYKIFSDKSWCKLDEPNLPMKIYQNRLDEYNFILCPIGNGIDTHRIWEAIYSGSIPIVKKHITFSYLEGINCIQVDKFENITEKMLTDFLNEKRNQNFDKLKIEYWMKVIKDDNDTSKIKIQINEKKLTNLLFSLQKKLWHRFESKKKIIVFNLRKIRKLVTRIFG